MIAPRARLRTPLLLIAAGLLLAAAALADAPLAGWVHAHGLRELVHDSPIAFVIKWPGVFYFTASLAVLMVILDRRKWREAVLLLISGVISGLFYSLLKWYVGRTRPFPKKPPLVPPFEFHPFHGGIPGLWRNQNQAFPSGHTCLAFATAAALAMIYPRGRIVFYAIAALVGVERVLEGAHYPSDVVAGAIFGIAAAFVAQWILSRCYPGQSVAVN